MSYSRQDRKATYDSDYLDRLASPSTTQRRYAVGSRYSSMNGANSGGMYGGGSSISSNYGSNRSALHTMRQMAEPLRGHEGVSSRLTSGVSDRIIERPTAYRYQQYNGTKSAPSSGSLPISGSGALGVGVERENTTTTSGRMSLYNKDSDRDYSSTSAAASARRLPTPTSREPPPPARPSPPVSRIASSRRQTSTSARNHIPPGLQNLGNTCFMNSILQCLVHTPELAHSFLDGGYSEGLKTSVGGRRSSLAHAMCEVVRSLVGPESMSGGAYTPRAFLNCVSSWDRRFSGGRQHDSQEFLHSLLDGLQSECNRVKGKPKYKELQGKGTVAQQADEAWEYSKSWNNSFIDDAVGGQLQSTVTCQRCHRSTHCFDPFLDLSVPIPKKRMGEVNLHDCMLAFTETETLDGREKYHCEHCKSPQPITKKLTIYRPPRILILHLKRFSSSSGGMMSRFASHSKDNTTVAFDIHNLDLSRYTSQESRSQVKVVYDLYAVSNHSGSLSGGHYTAYAKCENSDTWYSFNDAYVSPMGSSMAASKEAYVLFYRRRSY